MALFRKKRASTPPGGEGVVFRQADAQRIANAVHAHETGRRGRHPSTLPRAPGGGSGSIAVARFTGAWAKDTIKEVQFISNTASTASVSNITANVAPPGTLSTYRRCLISQDGTAFILVTAECG